jgi:hypothetical protein
MQKISTLLGIIIILVVAVILFGGVFAWQHYQIKNNEKGELNQKIIKTIRDVDLRNYLTTVYNEASTLCGAGQEPIQIGYIKYADLDSDGKEEAIVRASSCLTGTAGPDINAVYRLLPTEKVVEIKINRNKYLDSWKDYGLTAKDGKLLETLPIYADNDANCCPSKGTREITYKFVNGEFFVDKVTELP